MDPRSPSPIAPTLPEGAPAADDVGNAQKPTYTTVGSIYNPGTSVPLQPPTRRGRQLRWPNAVQPETPFIHKSLLAAFPPKHGPPQSPPLTAATFQQYSPLQQNYDRAVSPQNELEQSVLAGLDMSPDMAPAKTAPGRASSAGSDKLDQANTAGEEGGGGPTADMEVLAAAQFNVKALTNLASYPNPMQRAAQKLLARGRPALSAATNVPRPPVSSSLISPSPREAGPDRVAASGSLRLAHMGFTAVNLNVKPELTAGQQSRPGGLARAGLQARPEPALPLRHRPGGVEMGAGRLPTLAKGPGAPAPLTAGPPGQRQYRASTFQTTIRALQESAEKPGPQDEPETETASQIYRPLPIRHGRPAPGTTRSADSSCPSSPASSEGSFSLRSLREGSVPDDGGYSWVPPSVVRETLGEDALRYYYPRGLPADWGEVKKRSEPDWLEVRRRREPLAFERTPEGIAEHNARVDAAFYAGGAEMGKSIETIIHEAEHRHFQKRLGVDEIKQQNSARAATDAERNPRSQYRHISVEEANAVPTSIHSRPLMIMAFATLLSVAEAQQSVTSSRPTNFGGANRSTTANVPEGGSE